MGLLGIIVNVLSIFIVPVYFFKNRSLKIHPFYNAPPPYYIPPNHRSTREIADNGLFHNVALSLGIGVGMLILGVVIVYGIIFMRLWASMSLLNGTKKVRCFITFIMNNICYLIILFSQRNHKQVLIYVIIDGIFMTVSLLSSWIIHPLYFLDYFMIY